MTNNNHPITPPDDLQEQWKQEWLRVRPAMTPCIQWMLAKSSRWGYEQRGAVNEAELQKARDEELEACIKLLADLGGDGEMIRRYRRPKPPSLKEQALQALDCLCVNHTKATAHENIIRRALNALSD